MNTSCVSVKAEELQTACELWLDGRKERVNNKIKKAIEDAMLEKVFWSNLNKLKNPFKKRSYDEAFEHVHNYLPDWHMFTIAGKIQFKGSTTQDRVEKILYACKVPHYGFVNLSVEDNAILEGYYEQTF